MPDIILQDDLRIRCSGRAVAVNISGKQSSSAQAVAFAGQRFDVSTQRHLCIVRADRPVRIDIAAGKIVREQIGEIARRTGSIEAGICAVGMRLRIGGAVSAGELFRSRRTYMRMPPHRGGRDPTVRPHKSQ